MPYKTCPKTIPSLDEAHFRWSFLIFRHVPWSAMRSVPNLWRVFNACSRASRCIKNLPFYVLAMFPSTYTCKSSFCSMNVIRTHERNRLTPTHLENCWWTEVTPMSSRRRRLRGDASFNMKIQRICSHHRPACQVKQKFLLFFDLIYLIYEPHLVLIQ